IDNSYSMAAIQTKTSASVRSLMDQLATNKLKVDIYLYTTTLYLANWSFPEMSATLNGSSIYPFTAFFYYFEDGVSKHSSWDYGTKNGSLGLKQLTAKNITTGANLPGPTYSIGSGETIEFTANFTPKSILGAPISIRQSDTAASISAAKSKLSNAVSSLGVDGSDKEQPLAVLQKIAKSYATSGGKRFASWIVTNEDDQTRSELLTLKNSYQNVPGGVQLQFNYYESVARFAYEYRVPDYFRDGVLVTPAYWVEATGAVGLPPCGASCSKTPGFFTCSAEELAFTEAYTADMIPKWGASYRPAPSLKCVRQTYLTTGNSANLPSGTTCNTVLPALGNQTGIAWGTSRWAIGINRAAASPFCVEKAIPDQVVKVDPRIAATAPVGDLSTSINAQLSTIFGPRGYGIALIANDGTNCGQGGETKTPPILSRLLASSPSPDQGLGLCAPDYNSLATKLAEYALENPETTYAHGMNKNDIESLTVRYQGETVDRTIPTD
ncbi:MAG: hypothetical protein NTV34_14860, partial [Proteobacteria bacterium]|nr:hypothetical protein [Pseudomonadota bacterium]